MNIELHIDERGLPFLRLDAFETNIKKEISNELLEFFIKKARENGIEIRSEVEPDSENLFASIRIKEKEE